MPETSAIQATYESFDEFLKHIIKDFYIRRGKTHPVEYAALLWASGQALSIGVDTLKEGSVSKKLATGAVGAVLLRYGLKAALGGPLGIIATGISAAGAGGYLVRNQPKITKLRGKYKTHISEAKESYDKALQQYQTGRFTASERNLMMDGLSHRLMQNLMAPVPDDPILAPDDENSQP